MTNSNLGNNDGGETLKTLPEFHLLKRTYSEGEWFIIGTLTHAKETSAETQLLRFKQMMHALGKPNRTFGQRLHWLVRVGGGEGTKTHTHLHFLLGKHRLVNGHNCSCSAEEVIKFCSKYWNRYGMIERQCIEPFDLSQNGISYVLRDEELEQERIVEMSKALKSVIKKSQDSSRIFVDRDPLAVKIVNALRAKGAIAGFGDEMEELRMAAAARLSFPRLEVN